MNRHQLTTLVVALACFLAVALAATTLASAVGTDPSEAVDLNYDLLPIDEGDAADLHREIRSNAADARGEPPGDGDVPGSTGTASGGTDDLGGDAAPAGGSRTGAETRRSGDGTEDSTADDAGDGPGERRSSERRSDWTADRADGPQRRSDEGVAIDDPNVDGSADPSPDENDAGEEGLQPDPAGDVRAIDRSDGDGDGGVLTGGEGGDGSVVVGVEEESGPLGIVPEPRGLPGALLWLLGAVVLARVLLWLGRRVRARQRGTEPASEPSEDAADRRLTDGPPADENAVYRSWAALVRRLDVEESERLTTRECAAAARSAGMDGDAVAALRRTFEEVRYGGRPVTDDRLRRARRLSRKLGLGPGDRS